MSLDYLETPWTGDYWTKYPNGLTVYEAIIDWVNKVNLMVEQLNLTQKQIDQLFTDTLPENIEAVMDAWYLDGTITTIVNNAVLGLPYTSEILGLDETSTAAEIETALNALDSGSVVIFSGLFNFDAEVELTTKIKLIGNNAQFKLADPFTLKDSDTMVMFRVGVAGVEFHGIDFYTAATLSNASKNNAYLWVTEGQTIAQNCNFYGLPGGGSNFNGAVGIIGGGSDPGHNIISDCYFEDNPGAVFLQQKQSTILNCIAIEPKDVSFVINSTSAYGCKIVGCTVNNDATTCSMHVGVEQGSNDFVITDNIINGLKNGIGIGLLNVGGITDIGNGGVIANNVINGLDITSTSPNTGIAVNQYYTNVKIHDNVIQNIGGGSSSSTGIFVTLGADAEHEVYNNKLMDNDINYIMYLALSDRTANPARVEFRNNVVNTSNSIIFIITGTNVAGNTVVIKNNDFRNAAEGIRGADITAIEEMTLENNRFESVTAPTNIPFLGGILITGFNVYGANHPHVISNKRHSEFYTSTATITPTDGDWLQGDIIKKTDPSAGSNYAAICTTAGNPGTWKGFGAIDS